MGCCDVVALRHSVCMATLILAWALVIAGVVSPWWRCAEDEEQDLTSYEGLWQYCSRVGDYETTCQLSQRNSGLWRALQVVKLTSLLLLTCGLTCLMVEALCCPPCKPSPCCATNRCPPSFCLTLLGGLLSLVGDLLYVGHMEYHHTTRLAQEHEYYWSFALSVGGSSFSLFSAFTIVLTACIVFPRDPSAQRPELRRSGTARPRHWSDNRLYRTNRGSESSWQYYPNRRPRSQGRDDLREDSFRPYFISDAFRRSYHPYLIYDPRPYRSRFPDPYRGSDHPYVVDGRSLTSSFRRPSEGSDRGHYPRVVQSGSRLYPDLRELEARRNYSADVGSRRSGPVWEEHPVGRIATAPELSDSRNSLRDSATDEELPGYFPQSGERSHVESDPRPSRPTSRTPTTASIGDLSTIHPPSDGTDYRGQARSVENRSDSSTPQPPPEARVETHVEGGSGAPVEVSSQTHAQGVNPTRSSSATSSSSGQRRVQFEDERDWHPQACSTARPARQESPVRASRQVHGRSDGRLERNQEGILRSTVESSGGAMGRVHPPVGSPEHEALVERLQAAGSVEPRDYRWTADMERDPGLQGQRSALRRPRPSPRRRPALPLPEDSEDYIGYWWGRWNRHPGLRRMVFKTRQGPDFDPTEYSEWGSFANSAHTTFGRRLLGDIGNPS